MGMESPVAAERLMTPTAQTNAVGSCPGDPAARRVFCCLDLSGTSSQPASRAAVAARRRCNPVMVRVELCYEHYA